MVKKSFPRLPLLVDRTEPITRELRSAMIPFGGQWVDMAARRFGAHENDATTTIDLQGWHTNFDDLDDRINFGTGYEIGVVPNMGVSSPIHSGILILDHDGSEGNFIGMRESSADIVFQLYVNSSNLLTTTIGASGSLRNATSLGTGRMVVGWSHSSPNNFTAQYKNGVEWHSEANSSSPTGADGTIAMMLGNHAGSYPYGGKIYGALIWNRFLTATEHRIVADNWLKVFKSTIVYVPTFPYDPTVTVEVTPEPGAPTLTITLTDTAGNPLPNLSGLTWAWFDETSPESLTSPTDVGNAETTDGSGQFSVELTNTSLTEGQTGTLTLRDSTGYIYGYYEVTL